MPNDGEPRDMSVNVSVFNKICVVSSSCYSMRHHPGKPVASFEKANMYAE